MNSLPETGTAALLEILSPHLDDALINEKLGRSSGPGRPRAFSSAQLFRVLLLSLLTPAHSFNLLLKLLPENRAWRRFAGLPNQRLLPDAKMLHQFRRRLDVCTLRQINARLLAPLLESLDPARSTLAVMDATDLPAPVSDGFKKKGPSRLLALQSEHARKKRARAVFLSATKNIPCAFGIRRPPRPLC